MNTQILEYILAIAEEKSVSRAADRFLLSQPVMSHHLKNVEESLGASLFMRTGNGMVPTASGVLFLNNAKVILLEKELLEQSIAKMRPKKYHSLNVIVDTPYLHYFTEEISAPFSELFPDFPLTVDTGNSLQARFSLQKGEADFAVLTSATPHPHDYESMSLFSDTLVCVCSGEYHSLTCGDDIKTAVEKGIVPVLHPIGSTFRMLEEENLSALGIFPSRILEAETFRETVDRIHSQPCFTYIPGSLLSFCRRKNRIHSISVCDLYCLIAYRPDILNGGPSLDLLRLIHEKMPHFITRASKNPLSNASL